MNDTVPTPIVPPVDGNARPILSVILPIFDEESVILKSFISYAASWHKGISPKSAASMPSRPRGSIL